MERREIQISRLPTLGSHLDILDLDSKPNHGSSGVQGFVPKPIPCKGQRGGTEMRFTVERETLT